MPKGKKLTEDEQLAVLRLQHEAIQSAIDKTNAARSARMAAETEASNLQLGHVVRSLIGKNGGFRSALIEEASKMVAAGDLAVQTKRKETFSKAKAALERALGPLASPEPEDLGEYEPVRPKLAAGC